MKFFLPVCALLLATPVVAATSVIRIQVDASDAPRRILHAHLQFPVQPGKLTLLYPKWIPGEHGPNGPITDVVGLKMTVRERTIEWQRDPEDMFAFNVEIPQEAELLDVGFDYLFSPSTGEFSSGSSSSANLAMISWNQVLLYPKGPKASELTYAADLRLPEGWKFGTALPVGNESLPNIQFSAVSLERLVDSPVISGLHFERWI